MKILVVDTETTGLEGCPYDLLVDFAAVEADTSAGTVRPVYTQTVGYDVSKWGPELRSSWIFKNSDLTVEEVGAARPLAAVAREVRSLLYRTRCTSYNVPFDFGKFLLRQPWGVRPWLCPDIMLRAHALVDGDYEFDDGSTSWPKLSKSYAELCPDDPGGIGGSQRHRALEDAVMAAHVLLELDSRGKY
ncbi:MAG: hypothetical protein IKP53_08435 [Candidatus Methanomethylophilaceae archaeon]|nr:hypothetical protein [Candidatus Methanomethylophilaceae archaeon]